MDREKEKIIEYAIIAGIGAALFAAVIAFNDAHAQLRISEGLRAIEGIPAFERSGASPEPAPAPSYDSCRNPEECRTHFSGGIRG